MYLRKYIPLFLLLIFGTSLTYAADEYSWHKFDGNIWNNTQQAWRSDASGKNQICDQKKAGQWFQQPKTLPVETYKCLPVSSTPKTVTGYTWHYMGSSLPYTSIGSDILPFYDSPSSPYYNSHSALKTQLCNKANNGRIQKSYGGYGGSYICQYTSNIPSSSSSKCTWWKETYPWSHDWKNTGSHLLTNPRGSSGRGWSSGNHPVLHTCDIGKQGYDVQWGYYDKKENTARCSCITTFEDDTPSKPPQNPQLPPETSNPTPTPTPTPVITISTLDIPHSCESVTATNTTWSSCTIQSVDVNGKIVCKQEATVTQTKGTHEWMCQKKYTYADEVVTSEVWEDASCPDETKQAQCAVNHPIVTPDPSFSRLSLTLGGNASPNFHYQAVGATHKIYFPLSLSGHTKENKPVAFDPRSIQNIQETSGFHSDQIHHTGQAISTHKHDLDTIKNVTPNTTLGSIALSSVAPVKTDIGRIELDYMGHHFVFPNLSYHFRKPGIGEIDSPTILGVKKRYRIGSSVATPGDISIPKSAISVSDTRNFKLEDTYIGTKDGNWIDVHTRVNSTAHSNSLADIPSLVVQPFRISYILEGQPVAYYLSAKDDADDMTPITNSGQEFLGAKILGNTQKTGNENLMGDNFSAIHTEKERTKIHQYAYQNIKNRSHNTVVGKVKYVKGDVRLPDHDLRPYDTLIVENGNVYIKENISASEQKNIIVLQNNYDVKKEFKKKRIRHRGHNRHIQNPENLKKGNILISPDVTKIHALLYADGAVLSIDTFGDIITADTGGLSSILEKQLHIYGSLFSRNTIGGALGKDGVYLFPGGAKTDNFDLAMMYDLNYLRRGNVGCEKNTQNKCIEPSATVIHFAGNSLFSKK